MEASIPNITSSSCQQVTMRWVLDNHTVWFSCAPLFRIPTLVAMNIKNVNCQYTQPRHWARSGKGAIVWAPHAGVSLVCGLPEERGEASLIRRPLCHQAQCVSYSPNAHNQNIKRSIQTSLTEWPPVTLHPVQSKFGVQLSYKGQYLTAGVRVLHYDINYCPEIKKIWNGGNRVGLTVWQTDCTVVQEAARYNIP
jgi:hypothetical protein